MALINFDCPECGHNLEVDERGAGFIVKCPECGNPLQVPDLPRSHRIRKIAMAGGVLFAILFLLGVNVYFWERNKGLQKERIEQQTVFTEFRKEAQALAMEQDAEISRLTRAVESAKVSANSALSAAALEAMDEADALAGELDATKRALLEASASERMGLLRAHMRKLVAAAKNSLPADPLISDAGAGRGIQGRKIVFPVLPGPEGQTLRENAAIMGVEDDKVSVSFPGGSATYTLTELHPGVAAYLPVDPLLVLPRKQWGPEVIRVQQTLNARRDQHLAHLRKAIEQQLPPE